MSAFADYLEELVALEAKDPVAAFRRLTSEEPPWPATDEEEATLRAFGETLAGDLAYENPRAYREILAQAEAKAEGAKKARRQDP